MMIRFLCCIFLLPLFCDVESFTASSTRRVSFSSSARSTRLSNLFMNANGAKVKNSNAHVLTSHPSSSSTSLNAVSVMSEQDMANTEDQSKSYLDDGFVFGLEGSGIERPRGKVASVVVEGDSLESQPYQRAIVLGTFLGNGAIAASSLQDILSNNGGDLATTTAQALALTVSSWLLADFGSGVLHWSVDNYGNGRTPIMGNIIAAFQGHHSAPWTITEREFSNNVHKLCIPFGLGTMGLIYLLTGPAVTFFLAVFCSLEILSQEFHKWSHMTKSEVPQWVNRLQDAGVIIGRKPHALHHRAPYDGNYCIVSGVCNEALDQSGAFRRMEHFIYNMNGIESNAWKIDPDLKERTLRGEHTPIRKR